MKRSLWILLVLPLLLPGCQKKADRPFTVGFMPKLVGIPYFNACKKGAQEAADELGIALRYDGPTEAEASLQNKMLDQWISSGEFDAVANRREGTGAGRCMARNPNVRFGSSAGVGLQHWLHRVGILIEAHHPDSMFV